MYSVVLFVHSWWRWIVVILMLIVILRSIRGLISDRNFSRADNAIGGALVGSTHMQLLLGLILYFGLSPLAFSALTSVPGAMAEPVIRYWGVEHLISMIIFVIFVQIGRIAARKTPVARSKFKRLLVWNGLALVVLMGSMPWPSAKETSRPLFRMHTPSALISK